MSHELCSLFKDHSRYGLSQRKTILRCNILSHWLSSYPEWSLLFLHYVEFGHWSVFSHPAVLVLAYNCPMQCHWINLEAWVNVSHELLTLKVWGRSYLSLSRSVSWLLMPWLLASLGHQHPWYRLCRKGKFLSYLRKHFNYLCHVNVEEWYEM